MNNEPITAADMITRVFSNISKNQLEESNSLFNAWSDTVSKIDGYGEKLAAHTKVIDLKNGTLLVETDHPGWTQILQVYENFIIKGMQWKAPELSIKTLAYRLEGSNARLH